MTEPIPTHDELVARAQKVASEVRRYELESDERRSLHPASVKAMRDAGLFKVIQPRRIGGYEHGLPTLHAVSEALGAGCTAASWVYTVTGAHTWVMGMYPEEVQDEIYEDDPDTLIPGTLAAQGKATPVDGGFRISGQWQFASGCDHARWGLFCARQTDSEKGAPKHIHVMVPAADYEIEDTWHVMGLRGTGSKDVVMNDAFVPTHRALPTGDLFDGATPAASRHATEVYRYPILPSLTYLLTGPVLAMADRIYEAHVERTAGRRDRYDGASKADKPTAQLRVAESWAEIESARNFVRDIEADYRRWLDQGVLPTDEGARLGQVACRVRGETLRARGGAIVRVVGGQHGL